MTPPGLTCSRCRGQLYPHTAIRTEGGFTHAHRCPRMCSVEDCTSKHHSSGYCSKHYHRLKNHGDPLVEPKAVDAEARLEDVRWMAETGECLTGAARRLGMKRNTLEVWLARNDPDTLAVVIAREPRDHNRVIDGVSVSSIIGQTARRQRRRERERSAA